MTGLDSNFLVPNGTMVIVLIVLAVAGLVVLCAIGGLVWWLVRRAGRSPVGRTNDQPTS